ncbi:MAG: hypothetical protein JWO11_140 [Nocardioides sp.]|nr:hypothetical protein [Nocardioides sp.]
MKPRKKTVLAAGVVVAGVVAVTGAAVATQGDDEPGSHDYTRQQAADATSAALDATGGGRPNSVERDSENGATWEVEVTKSDGNTVDVRLDDSYRVVVIEGDSEPAGG